RKKIILLPWRPSSMSRALSSGIGSGRAIDRLSLLSRASAYSAASEPALLLRAYSTVQAASPILGDGLLIPRRQPGSGLFQSTFTTHPFRLTPARSHPFIHPPSEDNGFLATVSSGGETPQPPAVL